MRRVESQLWTLNCDWEANLGLPHLHPDAISRLRKAYAKGLDIAVDELRTPGMPGDRTGAGTKNNPASAQHRSGGASDDENWPTLADAAAKRSGKGR